MAFKFSKRGDKGETSLLGGQRVPKFSDRPETYGILDEASSVLGVAKAATDNPKIKDIIFEVQKDLLTIGAELSTLEEDYDKLGRTISEEDSKRLEDVIADLQKSCVLGREFIYPGGTVIAAQIDVSRTIVRRAERRAAKMKHDGLIYNENINEYLNRLADMLFTLARYEETISKKG